MAALGEMRLPPLSPEACEWLAGRGHSFRHLFEELRDLAVHLGAAAGNQQAERAFGVQIGRERRGATYEGKIPAPKKAPKAEAAAE